MTLPAVPWSALQQRVDALNERLLTGGLDQSQRHGVQKELSFLSTLLTHHQHIVSLQQKLASVQSQSASNQDADLVELFNEEIADLQQQIFLAEQNEQILLCPVDPLDDRPVFLEVRAGTGGQEAALFAGDLLGMYSAYALSKGWRVSVASESSTDLGGYREVVVHIEGTNVYQHLRHESGVHRVQRVPATETSGRIHTSTATVAVLPEAEEVDVHCSSSDLRIDVYRSSGAGGQHVNTTDSAVRITHLPTGLVVTCQDERSQHKNKAKALKILQSRLLSLQTEKAESERSKLRREQVGGGMRSEKVRTYNFPQNRVTDHQVEVTLKKLDRVIAGDLGDLIEPLIKKHHDDRCARFVASLSLAS